MNHSDLSLTHLTRPAAESPTGKPPLLLLLHGVGSNEQDLMALAPHLDDRFFVVSARAPLPLGPGAYGWYHVQFTPQGPAYDPEEAQRGWKSVVRFRDEAVAAYGLDPDRVFLMGFSQGAIMSIAVSLMQPQTVAGVVAMSGRLLPEVPPQITAVEKLTGKPYLVVHGTRDTVLPIAYGREIRDQLSNLDVSLSYHEYEMAHEVTSDSLRDITAWLTAQINETKS